MNVTNTIVDFFQGNPFNNSIGAHIERATDSKNESENWTLFMETCDNINSIEDGPKLAIRAIKRLLNADIVNNTTTILYTLVLLETCVKNCGYRFHLVVCSRDFLQELEKIVLGTQSPKLSKNDVPIVIRDRVLVLIQSWFDSFKRQPDLREIEYTYMHLLENGVQFPEIVIGYVIQSTTASIKPSSQPTSTNITPQVSVSDPEPQVEPTMSDNAVDKLSKNLLTVQANIDCLSELMRDYPPSGTVPDDVICLMKNLESICQQMQLRLVELVNTWDETDQKDVAVLFDLLRVNDEMNSVLIQYERYERTRTGQSNKNMSEEELSDAISKASLSDVCTSQQMSADGGSQLKSLSSSKSRDDKAEPGLALGTDETESLLSTEHNTGAAISSRTALSSQEFDQFLSEQAKNSLSINGDYSADISSPGRQRPFGGTKRRDNGKESFDL